MQKNIEKIRVKENLTWEISSIWKIESAKILRNEEKKISTLTNLIEI